MSAPQLPSREPREVIEPATSTEVWFRAAVPLRSTQVVRGVAHERHQESKAKPSWICFPVRCEKIQSVKRAQLSQQLGYEREDADKRLLYSIFHSYSACSLAASM